MLHPVSQVSYLYFVFNNKYYLIYCKKFNAKSNINRILYIFKNNIIQYVPRFVHTVSDLQIYFDNGPPATTKNNHEVT